jgi:hypothetical protein
MKRAAGMNTAIGKPRSGELIELRFHWGEAYECRFPGAQGDWRARGERILRG